MQQHLIVDPVSAGPEPAREGRAVLGDLAGVTVGFLSNSKTNADAILERVAEAFAERFGVTARLYVKRVPSISAEPELLDRIAEECGAAVVAMLDCGSCASWACADMVEPRSAACRSAAWPAIASTRSRARCCRSRTRATSAWRSWPIPLPGSRASRPRHASPPRPSTRRSRR